MAYLVSADIKHTSGSLAGIVSPAGFACTYPTHHDALRVVAWIAQVRRDDDFVRAPGSGHKYQFVSAPRCEEVRPLTFVGCAPRGAQQ